MIKDQHKGSNCSVFPDSTDAGAAMQAERFSQLARHPLAPSSSQNPGVACTPLGFILFFWVSRQFGSQLQVSRHRSTAQTRARDSDQAVPVPLMRLVMPTP